MFQLVALEEPREEVQIISFNPGLLYNKYMKSLGLPRDAFDSRESSLLKSRSTADLEAGEMAAAFSVWAATKAAAFLHGRFVWASWDVDELASEENRRQIAEDPYFLRTTIAPLKLGFKM